MIFIFDRWKTEYSDDAFNDGYNWWGYRWLQIMMIVDKKIDDVNDDDDDDVTDVDDDFYDCNNVDNIDSDCLKMMLKFLY